MRIQILFAGGMLLAASQSYQVKWVGEMRKVMMMGEDKGILSLDSFKDQAHLYALGPVAGLNGEITVIDSEPLVATVRAGKPLVKRTFQVQAPLLVWVQVAKWAAVPIPPSVRSLADLDQFVAVSARKAALDMSTPVPFRFTGTAQEIQMHIVNRQGREAKGRQAHEAIEVKFPLTHAAVELIGFWSDHQAGVLTHMGSNVHVHGRTVDNQLSGHVDSLKIDSGQLWLPANP